MAKAVYVQKNKETKTYFSEYAFPYIMFVFDQQFLIVEVNVFGSIILLDDVRNISGKKVKDLNIPNFLKRLITENLKLCKKEKREVVFEYMLKIDDNFNHFRCRLFLKNQFIFAIVNDITEEKKKQQILFEKKQEFQEIFNEISIAVVQVGSNGEIKYMNTLFTNLIKSVGMEFSDNVSSYIGKKWFEVLKANNKSDKTHCVALGHLFVDVANRKRIVDDEILHLITFVDVTEREKFKMALKSCTKENKILVDTSPNGIMISDFQKIYYTNSEALKILGFKKIRDVDFSKVMDKQSLDAIRECLINTQRINEEFVDYTIIPFDTKKPIVINTKLTLIDYQGKPAFQIMFRNNLAEKLLLEESVKKQVLESHNRNLKAEIAHRIEIENKLNKIIDENKVLINEVHHRVKNNYQIISSMLNRSMANITDPASIKVIMGIKKRLISMAIVNEFYMDAENYNSILLINYLKKIHQNFIRENGSVSIVHKINFNTTIHNLIVDLNDAVPIGLIFNEILTILYQLVDNLSDNFCNFVSLKWQHKNTLMFTIRFHKEMSKLLEKQLNSSMEMSSIRDLLEQVDGYIVSHFEKAELQLIVKISKIS